MLGRLGRRLAAKSWEMRSLGGHWSKEASRGSKDMPNAGKVPVSGGSDFDAEVRAVCKLVAQGSSWSDEKERALERLDVRLTKQLVKFVISRVQDANVALCFFRWAARRDESMAGSGVYYKLIRSLCAAHRFQVVWELLVEMRALGYRIKSEVFSTLIKFYARLKLVDAALEAFNRIGEFRCQPNLGTYEVIIDALVSSGRQGEAAAIHSAMRDAGIGPSEGILRNLLLGFASAGQVDSVGKLLVEIPNMGFVVDASMHNAVIGGYLTANKVAEAQQVFVQLQASGREAGALSCNMLMVHYCEAGKVAQAYEIFRSMVAKKDISVLALNLLATGLAKERRTTEACEVLESRGDLANVVTYGILLDTLCKGGEVGRALEMLEGMKKMCRVAPNVVAYTSVIDGLCKTGEIEQAIKLFRQMQTSGCCPNGFTYTVLIGGLCRSARLEEAFALLRTMSIRGCRPTLMSKNTLLNGICKQIILDRRRRRFGKQAESLFLEDMARSFQMEADRLGLLYSCLEYMFGDADGDPPNLCTYSIVLHFLCKADRVVEAHRVWNAMRTRDTVTYNSFLYGLLRAKNLQVAEELYEEMLWSNGSSSSSSSSSSSPSIVTHSLLMDGYFKQGDFARAWDVYNKMTSAGILPDPVLYNIMLNGFCKARLGSEATELTADMLHHGVRPSVETYSILIQGLCSEGNFQPVSTIIDRMKERGCEPDVVTYNILLQYLCNHGRFHESVELFRDMKRCCSHNATTWGIMVDGLLALGDCQVAETIFTELVKDGCFPDYLTYGVFADRLLRTTDRPEVFDLDGYQTFLSFSYNRIADFFVR